MGLLFMYDINMRISRNYKQVGTHIPMLLNIIPKTKGDVCELGAGFSSTPILHWLCQGRKLYTYENNPEWFKFARKFQTKNHRIRPEPDYDKHWSVVFIDHSTRIDGKMPKDGRQRGDDMLKFKDVDIFILHDTEPGEEKHYHYDIVFPKFKYRLDWTECRPHTSAISNKIDVTKWQE
jgi:hypothetical protein